MKMQLLFLFKILLFQVQSDTRYTFQNQYSDELLDCGDDKVGDGITVTRGGEFVPPRQKWHLDDENYLITEHGLYPATTKSKCYILGDTLFDIWVGEKIVQQILNMM